MKANIVGKKAKFSVREKEENIIQVEIKTGSKSILISMEPKQLRQLIGKLLLFETEEEKRYEERERLWNSFC